MLLLLNEHGDPQFLFPNLSSYIINNQLAKFEKNLSVGSISVEWPLKSVLQSFLYFFLRNGQRLACVHPIRMHADSWESISSYLSALPLSKCIPNWISGHTLDSIHCFYNRARHFSRWKVEISPTMTSAWTISMNHSFLFHKILANQSAR